jgi:hypothetical protein
VRPLSRIMKNSADNKLPMMPTNAMTMMIFIVSSIARARSGLGRTQRTDPAQAKQAIPCCMKRAAS